MIAELLSLLALGAPVADLRACPVTKPATASGRFGTARLWTFLPRDGVLRVRRGADGRLGDKLGWVPDRDRGVSLAVSGRRLDAPGTLRVLSVNWGYSSTGKGSWASAVVFPRPGCWRLTGKAGTTTLTYVVKVVSA